MSELPCLACCTMTQILISSRKWTDGWLLFCRFTKAVMAVYLWPNTDMNNMTVCRQWSVYRRPPVRSSNTIDSLSEADCLQGKVSIICCDKAQPLNAVNVLLLVYTNIWPSGIHRTLRNWPSAIMHTYSAYICARIPLITQFSTCSVQKVTLFNRQKQQKTVILGFILMTGLQNRHTSAVWFILIFKPMIFLISHLIDYRRCWIYVSCEDWSEVKPLFVNVYYFRVMMNL